ncbi:MAG: hypothetical protein FWB98_00980 [Defluviitaleaceae bacterium]|nr:hypothetical protein [Defluviitaleaceae bacterium]
MFKKLCVLVLALFAFAACSNELDADTGFDYDAARYDFFLNWEYDFSDIADWGFLQSFDFLSDVVTLEQLEIAKDYIGITDNAFFEEKFVTYVGRALLGGIFHTDLLRYYDSQPFSEDTENPRRIVVKIYELYLMWAMHQRNMSNLNESPSRFSIEFGRYLID